MPIYNGHRPGRELIKNRFRLNRFSLNDALRFEQLQKWNEKLTNNKGNINEMALQTVREKSFVNAYYGSHAPLSQQTI